MLGCGKVCSRRPGLELVPYPLHPTCMCFYVLLPHFQIWKVLWMGDILLESLYYWLIWIVCKCSAYNVCKP